MLNTPRGILFKDLECVTCIHMYGGTVCCSNENICVEINRPVVPISHCVHVTVCFAMDD